VEHRLHAQSWLETLHRQHPSGLNCRLALFDTLLHYSAVDKNSISSYDTIATNMLYNCLFLHPSYPSLPLYLFYFLADTCASLASLLSLFIYLFIFIYTESRTKVHIKIQNKAIKYTETPRKSISLLTKERIIICLLLMHNMSLITLTSEQCAADWRKTLRSTKFLLIEVSLDSTSQDVNSKT